MNLFLILIHNEIFRASAAGFLVALGIDLHAYSEAAEGVKFNWKKAAARWFAGAITGSGVTGWMGN